MGIQQREGLAGSSPLLRFGEACWDPLGQRLIVRGAYVKLPWRASECLGALVQAQGAVVSKDELKTQIWGNALMEESNLAQCIAALRKALDPARDGGSYIETVARVGYRLAVPVTEETAQEARPAPDSARKPKLALVAGGLLVIFALAAGALLANHRRAEKFRAADELIHRALVLVRRNDPTDAAKANELLRQATDILPDYPLAQAAMAEWAARRGNGSFDAAIELARRAVTRDPNCGECLAIAGYVLMTRAWRWEEAGKYLARANEIDATDPSRRLWYAEWLAVHRRFDEALQHAESVVKSHPGEPRAHAMKAMILFLSGRHAEAIKAGENALSLNLQFNAAHYWMFRAAQQLRDDHAAMMARARQLTSLYARHEEEFQKLHHQFLEIHKQGGRRALVQNWLREMGEGPSLDVQRYARAQWAMWIGENEKAIEELQAAVKTKPYHLIYVSADPAFEPLRGDARFREVVRQVGLAAPSS